jgi:hypothetical protein
MSTFPPPEAGQHVKIVFRNGTVTEGIVEEWFGNVAYLKALDSESKLIITNPEQDIMLIKVVIEKAPKAEDPEDCPSEEEADAFASQFQEAAETHDPTNPDDRKTLAELRIEMAKQERKIIAEKLRHHRPSTGPGKVQYGYPGLGKKPRTK